MNVNKLNSVLNQTRGRFFGLQTKQGDSINAQLVGVSPFYVTVYDKHLGVTRKLAKSSIASVTSGGRRFNV